MVTAFGYSPAAKELFARRLSSLDSWRRACISYDQLRADGVLIRGTYGFFFGRETDKFFVLFFGGFWLGVSLALEALGAGRHGWDKRF